MSSGNHTLKVLLLLELFASQGLIEDGSVSGPLLFFDWTVIYFARLF